MEDIKLKVNKNFHPLVQVTSLLSPEYLEYMEPATNSKPKSEESLHEVSNSRLFSHSYY